MAATTDFRLASLLAGLALAAAGCSGDGEPRGRPPAGDPTPAPAPASQTVVLEIRTGEEFLVPPLARLAEPPAVSVHGDGRVVVARGRPATATARTVPALVERRLTKEGLDALVAAAREAGLRGPDRDFLYSLPTDLATTVFTAAVDGERHVTLAYGLGGQRNLFGLLARDVPRAHREPRRRLLALEAMFRNLEESLPEGTVGAPRPYEPATLAVYVEPAEDWFPGRRALASARRSATPWPLAQSLRDFGEPVAGMPEIRCGTVEGAELETVLAAAQDAKAFSAWESVGAFYLFELRPLLPGEPPCRGF